MRPSLLSLYSLFTLSLLSLYSLFTLSLLSLYSLFTLSLLSLYSLFTLSLLSLYSLSLLSLFTLSYFRGKGILEKAIIHSNLSYAIIRPTVIFGHEDILINNITWFLTKFPVFAIPGDGDYRLQPVFVEDVAEIAVNAGVSSDNIILDAVGPEIFRYEELIRLIADRVQSKARIIHLRPGLALFLSKCIGYMVNDVVLTSDEVEGLMANLLVSKNPPTGKTRLSDWLSQHADTIGTKYASELNRHYR